MKQFISKCEKDTIEFACKIAEKLTSKSVIVLNGDLGSGKTKFVQGILKYFGLENEISSPTFTIVNEYISPVQAIYHFDVYRLENADEFYEMGGEEYFEKGICLIEWGNLIKEALPSDYIQINFYKDTNKEDYRRLEIEVFGNAVLNIFP